MDGIAEPMPAVLTVAGKVVEITIKRYLTVNKMKRQKVGIAAGVHGVPAGFHGWHRCGKCYSTVNDCSSTGTVQRAPSVETQASSIRASPVAPVARSVPM